MTSIDKNAPCPCGSTKKYKHCCLRKEQQREKEASAQAAMVSARAKMALQHLQAGQLQLAKATYQQILDAIPDHVESLQWMGVIEHQQGNSTAAIDRLNAALEVDAKTPLVHATLGNIYKDLGRTADAIQSYRYAIDLRDVFPEARNNLAIALSMAGQLDEAIESYRSALEQSPNFANAHNGLGTALLQKGQVADAIAALRKALALAPKHPQANFNLGRALQANSPDESEKYYQQSLESNPNQYEAWIQIGGLQWDLGKINESGFSFQQAYRIRPNDGLKVLVGLTTPKIMGTRAEVSASREQFEKNLEALCHAGIVLTDPVKELCQTNFYLAYHGMNDKEIQEKIAGFYRAACPSLNYVARHCMVEKPAALKRRIGYFSKYIVNHSVALSFSRIVEESASIDAFDVFLISQEDNDKDAVQKAYRDFRGTLVSIPSDLDGARARIAELELDILVYLDIGMDPLSYFLAFSRLARVQCVMGGHPVTTGIQTIDYFLSCDLAEPDNADDHYSEKLVRLPFGLFYFDKPALPVQFKSRQELGLAIDRHLYVCPMMLHKLHPDFDEAIVRILELDPTGQVILFEHKKFRNYRVQLEKRFEKTVPAAVRDRLVFYPWVANTTDFLSVNRVADVVLNPFHFGIGTTAIFTCSVGTPFVTKPDEFMRGRMGYFFAKLLGIDECIANDTEAYAQRAVAIAEDAGLRDRITSKMLANNHVLFENRQAIDDVNAFLRDVPLQPA